MLNIKANPAVKGVAIRAVGMLSSMGREEHTNRTKTLVTEHVNTQQIEAMGIVVFGSYTSDPDKFNDSTPTKNQAERGKFFINPTIPPINHWGLSSSELDPVVQ
jgi:hypothetical protein